MIHIGLKGVLLLTLIAFVSRSLPYSSLTPIWTPHNQLYAGTATIASVIMVSPPSSPQIICPFAAAFTGVPQLAYGIKNYRGNDSLIQQFFQIQTLNLNQISFSLKLQISGVTNLWLLEVSFLAIDPNFPHLLNAFANVPISDPADFTDINQNLATATYCNAFDYNLLATGLTYNQFPQPYSSNVLLLFITNIWIRASASKQVSLSVDYTLDDPQFFSICVNTHSLLNISSLHFSMVFLNVDDLMASHTFLPFYGKNQFTNPGGFFPVPLTLFSNFIMGITEFTTLSGACGLEYQWEYGVGGATTGVSVLPSITISSIGGLNTSISSYFYLATWNCDPLHPYFNITALQCQNSCAYYYFGNTTALDCQLCSNTLCYTCSNNDSTICLSCDTTLHYVLSSGTCVCASGYYSLNGSCVLCSTGQAECVTCTYTMSNITVLFLLTNFNCTSCNATNNYFVQKNVTTLIYECIKCTLSNCLSCASLTTCLVCDPASGTSLSAALQCSLCSVTGCLTCGAISTVCLVCNGALGYTLDGTGCSLCAVACNCLGWVLPWISNKASCSTICGDGFIVGSEQCDDGNTNDYDGCSSSCTIEPYYACSGSTSSCYLTIDLTVVINYTAVSTTSCNHITFTFVVKPNVPVLSQPGVNWTGFISADSPSLVYIQDSLVVKDGKVSLSYTYTESIQGQKIIFKANPSNLLPGKIQLTQILPTTTVVTVAPNNNLAAFYCSEDVCNTKATLQSVVYASEGVSYAALLLSLLSCKIVGLELFGVLQLAFFTLSDYDSVNPLLASVLNRKEVNGFNQNIDLSAALSLSERVISNGFSSQIFLSSYNIMFLLQAVVILVGAVTYGVTYLINSDQKLQQNSSSRDLSSHSSRVQPETRSMFLHRMSKYILKEVLFTLIMFNMFNISFSIGLQLKYVGEVQPVAIICLLVSIAIIFGIILALLKADKLQFGEFFNKFKEDQLESKYMMVTLLYRFVLGVLLATLNEWVPGPLVFLGVNAALLTYISYCEPFHDIWQNRRSLLVHLTHFVILFVCLYYRFESANNPIESNNLNVPAVIELASIGLCIVVSIGMLVRQLYLKYFGQQVQSQMKITLTQQKIDVSGDLIRQDVQIQDCD